jgi:hypothetical protein
VTRITALAPMCIFRNITLSLCGVSGSVSISASRLSQRLGWRRGEIAVGHRPVYGYITGLELFVDGGFAQVQLVIANSR